MGQESEGWPTHTDPGGAAERIFIYLEKSGRTERKKRRTRLKVKEVQDFFRMELAAGAKGLNREVITGYCGDLLSDVMANSRPGAIWLTIQSHQNILAVAQLKELAAIVLVNGRLPDEETKAKAEEEGIPILLSPLPTYQLAGQFYELGIGRAEG